jgi:TolB protein
MKNKFPYKFVILIFFSLTIILLSQVHASENSSGLYIKVGDANLKKSLLALPAFQLNGSPNAAKSSLKVGKDLYDVLSNDLEVSGYFEFIKAAAFIEDVAKVGLRPATAEPGGFSFASWNQIGAEFLIRIGYHVVGDNLTVDTYSFFVPKQQTVLSKTYKSTVANVRTVAHTFANDLIKELTGRQAAFLSKVVTSRSTKPQQKEIFVMDWDGANSRQVTSHHSIAQSPTFSYDGKLIAYSQFAYHPTEKTRNVDLFTYELATGRRLLVSYRRGINSGASFTPDNKGILLTISQGGNPDIYKMSLDGRSIEKLTNAKNGELYVEPTMSPDGKKIAFSSTRSGKPMIYVMNPDGSDPKRMTFAGEYNSTPAWSPDGKKIAFAGLDKNHYDIFVMDADGTNMVRLTSAKMTNGKFADNEDPTFSPDGRQLLFRSNRTGKYQLYIVSIDGEVERRVTFDQHDYFKPRWSPSFE